MQIDITNKNWNKHISDEEILNREFTSGFLIQTNQHLPIFQELKDLVLSTYKVTAKFKYLGWNGDVLYCNGQKLIYRKDKFQDFTLGNNVKLVNHNLSRKGGGSNKYPSVAYEGAFAVIEFISYGLPYVNSVNGWGIEVISMEKI